MLYRLMYSSRSPVDLAEHELSDILNQARIRNAAEGLTGILLYHNRNILQVLEGPRGAVEACYDRISRDRRHTDLQLLGRGSAQKKFFSDWFMGYERPDTIAGATETSMITLEQLQDRLGELEGMEFSRARTAILSRLKAYLHAMSQLAEPLP